MLYHVFTLLIYHYYYLLLQLSKHILSDISCMYLMLLLDIDSGYVFIILSVSNIFHTIV